MPWNSGGGSDDDKPDDRKPGGPSPWGNPGSSPGGRPQGPPREPSPWGNPNGNPGGGQRPPGGPGGQGPDMDELIARGQAFINSLLPPGFGGRGPRRPTGGGGGGGFGGGFAGGRGAALILLVLVGVWLASGFYRVQPDEEGVVLRFGAFDRTALPGLNYHIPWPVESVLRPAVTRINRVEVGYRSAVDRGLVNTGREVAVRDVPQESLMLTGDENIIDINFAVFWRIRDAGAFLFNTRNPIFVIKAAAESEMREVIGRTPIQPALGPGRTQIEQAVTSGLQAILDQYGTGVQITQVSLQKSNPPDEVLDSFRDVQRANTEAETARNEADAYRNDIVPRARGDAARLTAEADGARQASVAESTGQAQRFLSVLKAYNAAKNVTLQRLYIETMQDVLTHTPSVIVDDGLKGVVPFLPLGDIGTMPPRPPVRLPTPTPATGNGR